MKDYAPQAKSYDSGQDKVDSALSKKLDPSRAKMQAFPKVLESE